MVSYEGSTLYDYSDYDVYFSTDASLFYPVAAYPEYHFYQEGTTHDIHVYYRNDSGRTLRCVTVTPVKTGSRDITSWFKIAATQALLDNAAPGAGYSIGDPMTALETTDFWVRVTSPASHAEGSYTDVVLRITAYVEGTHIFTTDVIIQE